MNAESPPNIHPYQRLITPDGKQVEIDTEMGLKRNSVKVHKHP